jgi:hypothetical protein
MVTEIAAKKIAGKSQKRNKRRREIAGEGVENGEQDVSWRRFRQFPHPYNFFRSGSS